MAALKTRETKASVAAFIRQIDEDRMRKSCHELNALMKKVTGKQPKMWGKAMVGFGNYHYKYASGREGDWFVTGFSPRKRDLTVYIMPGLDRYQTLMKHLGKYSTGRSCLYIRKPEDIDWKILSDLIAKSVRDMAKMYTCT
ncbi:MAG: DUF1801 domain-containing protein [Gammaproteobacteria bacterium]|nr:DUF1801 domain-containing protein [Gammaproteobacteria bacterium]MCZ6761868.1 DUF1801 domain-containing protein [Gammaproteobacteria bacterium]